MHLFESISLQIFLATFVVRGNVVVSTEVKVKALRIEKSALVSGVSLSLIKLAPRRKNIYQHRADRRTDREVRDRQVITGRELPAFEKGVEHLERFLYSL